MLKTRLPFRFRSQLVHFLQKGSQQLVLRNLFHDLPFLKQEPFPLAAGNATSASRASPGR